ncbi:hypothetical protein BKA70DRAFT_1323937 [Coprinopsis sp. MPI-PUGE-AT-0042]|nr:hypothetical protein BKA70DRAFT_1323937 [Coprinopsis sp. MPI-PUGE-AT-0042]
MRVSIVTFLLAASTAVVNAYDFDSRAISSRDVYDSSPSRGNPASPSAAKGADQKAAAAELQKWSAAVLDIKNALDKAKKSKPGSKERSKEGEMKKCLAFNEEGGGVPAGVRKPSTDPCKYNGNGFYPKWM